MINKDTKFLIVGLGLLGGSYALGLKQAGYCVSAIDINPESISYALTHEIIDEGTIDDTSLISQADAIIFGLYPKTMISWIQKYQSYFKPNIFITDVSGVKCGVIDVIQNNLRKDVEFISSHPMAGKEVSGVQFSDPNIFKIANFIITPTSKNTEKGIQFAKDIANVLNFHNITCLTPKKHDQMIGFVSQLTHVIAVSLMNTNDNTHLVEYTGDSFRDLTRIAKINEKLWSELFLLNKDILVKEIDDFSEELQNFRNKLIHDDVKGMEALFKQSTERRKLFDK